MRVKTTPKKSKAKKSATALSKSTLENMLANTYKKENETVGSYTVDPQLSDIRVKVYHDPSTKHTVVAHRGSASARDWFENALYLGNIEAGQGWNISKKRQKEAEKKYGVGNLTTIGHSKGALHAEKFGKRGGEIITLNKPVNIPHILSEVPSNQTDYTGEGDVVSILRPLQRGKKEVVLKKKKGVLSRAKKFLKDPLGSLLVEHSTETLNRLPSE
jgi:lambda repressor-like predicted transcriptional regulator